MQQRGIEPTVATYGTLITIASEAQAYGHVKESWGWLQASGLPVHITCVNSYLTALIKEVSAACSALLRSRSVHDWVGSCCACQEKAKGLVAGSSQAVPLVRRN
jgi:hypothetical protein